MPQKYRKKPVVVEAIQWTGETERFLEIFEFMGDGNREVWREGDCLIIDTLEGKRQASVGDYIIRGVKGEFYPCKPDIFRRGYEPVEDASVFPEGISQLPLSKRTKSALESAGVKTLTDLRKTSEEDLMDIYGFGFVARQEVRELLGREGE